MVMTHRPRTDKNSSSKVDGCKDEVETDRRTRTLPICFTFPADAVGGN